jgi:hypothetical protein
MHHDDSSTNLWAFSYHKLAREIGVIATLDSPQVSPTLQAEARRLDQAWREALAMPGDGVEDGPRKAATESALRKRSIEILVKVGRAD